MALLGGPARIFAPQQASKAVAPAAQQAADLAWRIAGLAADLGVGVALGLQLERPPLARGQRSQGTQDLALLDLLNGILIGRTVLQ